MTRKTRPCAPACTSGNMTPAAHQCIDRLRCRRMAGFSLDNEDFSAHPALRDPAPWPEAAVLAERNREVRASLERLLPKDREVIVMRYWGCMSNAEIARATGNTAVAVKSRLHRARARLAALLRQPAGRLDAEGQSHRSVPAETNAESLAA